MSVKTFIIIGILGILAMGVSGCNSKYYRNKPSVFMPAKNLLKESNISEIVKGDVNTSVVPYCMNAQESIINLDKTEHGMCDGYYVVDGSKIINIDENRSRVAVVNNLLMYSNENCRRFIDRFYYNGMLGKSGTSILNLKLLGLAIDIGEIKDFTAGELLRLSSTLNKNLTYRSKLKTKIVHMRDSNVSMAEMIDMIRTYDHACGILIDEEVISGRVEFNMSKEGN